MAPRPTDSLVRKISFAARVQLTLLLAIVALGASLVLWMSTLSSRAMAERRTKIRNIVEVAHHAFQHFGSLESEGKLSREEAQRLALDLLRRIRFEEREYYWVNDVGNRMVMHPIKRDLDGKDMSDFKDPTGKRIFAEFVRVAKESKDGGYVEYMWPKPGAPEPVAKMAYARLYEPWGWVVGAGVYLDDVNDALAAQRRLAFLCGGIMGAALFLAGWRATRSMKGAILGLRAEASKLTAAVTAGDLGVRADPDAVHFEFRPVVHGMNDVVEAFARPTRLSVDYIAVLARGELPAKIDEEYRGTFEEMKRNWNALIDVVAMRAQDIQLLTTAAAEGRLSARAEASRYSGYNGKLVGAVNALFDALAKPLGEFTGALEKLARRDLTGRMTGSYQGDFARLREAFNGAAGALHEALGQVGESAEQVKLAATQIASSSQAVAAGASEQAASLQQTHSSLETMSGMTRHSADSAAQASALAGGTKASAQAGAAVMGQMSAAMIKIRASAEGTSQIIKDISEIAFQTNLLALNAAVEAARAGEAGRGFAVVAEEVRSLALRAKEAAVKTEELIKESVRQAGEGESTAREVNEKLSEILGNAQKVSDIVAEIAASAKEQATGIEQLSQAVGEMDRVTQQNSASSEESSSSAEELSHQAEELAEMLGTFTMSRERARSGASASRGAQGLRREVRAGM